MEVKNHVLNGSNLCVLGVMGYKSYKLRVIKSISFGIV
jgi:hypothetical protein